MQTTTFRTPELEGKPGRESWMRKKDLPVLDLVSQISADFCREKQIFQQEKYYRLIFSGKRGPPSSKTSEVERALQNKGKQ